MKNLTVAALMFALTAATIRAQGELNEQTIVAEAAGAVRSANARAGIAQWQAEQRKAQEEEKARQEQQLQQQQAAQAAAAALRQQAAMYQKQLDREHSLWATQMEAQRLQQQRDEAAKRQLEAEREQQRFDQWCSQHKRECDEYKRQQAEQEAERARQFQESERQRAEQKAAHEAWRLEHPDLARQEDLKRADEIKKFEQSVGLRQ